MTGGATRGINQRGAIPIGLAVFAFVALVAFTVVRGDEKSPGPSHAGDANRAASSLSSDPISGAADSTPHSSSFDDLPIRHRDDKPATPGASAGDLGHPTLPSAPSLEAPRVLLALALVVGLIVLLRWAARRFFATPGTTGGSGAVQVLSRSAFSPRQQVVLIRVGRRVLVVSDNGQQLSSLAEISDADEVASLLGQVREGPGASPTKAFGNLFRRFSTAADEPESGPPGPRDEGGIETKTEVSDDPDDVAATRAELGSLMERVRLVSREFGRS